MVNDAKSLRSIYIQSWECNFFFDLPLWTLVGRATYYTFLDFWTSGESEERMYSAPAVVVVVVVFQLS